MKALVRKDPLDFPEMRDLTPLQQRFVIAVATRPGVDNTTIMREIDPDITPGSAKMKAWRWMHHPKVQAALLSLVPGDTVKMYPVVLKGLMDIAENPQAKDHAKVLLKLHEWLAPRHTESTLNVNVSHQGMSDSELMQALKQQMHDLGPVGAAALKAVTIIDVAHEEVSSELTDLEDVL